MNWWNRPVTNGQLISYALGVFIGLWLTSAVF